MSHARVEAGGLVLWLLVLLTAVFPYFEGTRNANERPRLMQAMAITDEHAFVIDGPAARGLDPGPDVARSPESGRLYPNKPPGASVVAAAAYVIARTYADAMGDPLTLRIFTWWARLFGGVFPTVLLAALAWRRYAATGAPEAARASVLLWALATPAYGYAHLLYGHALSALALTSGTWLLLDARSNEDERLAFRGGLVAGSALLVEYLTVFAALPLMGLLLAAPRHRLRLSAWAAFGACIPVALLGAYHDMAFGSPWSTGYHHVANPAFAAKHGVGMLGLSWPTVDGFVTQVIAPGSGLLWWAPLSLMGVYGLVKVASARGPWRAEAIVMLSLFVGFVVIASSLSFAGGWRVGPRYLVAVLPCLMLGWIATFRLVRERVIAFAVFGTLAVWSVLVNMAAGNLWPHFDLDHVRQPVSEVLLPLLVDRYEPYSVLDWFGFPHAVPIVIGLGIVVVLHALWRAGGSVFVSLIVVSASAAGGAALVFATRAMTPHESSERNLGSIRRNYEPDPRDRTKGHTAPLRRLSESTDPEKWGEIQPDPPSPQ